MRKLIVQQWVTVDSIAAEEDGGLSFVSGGPLFETTNKAFKASVMGLIDSVDTMILGANTYAQSKDYWPYADEQGEYGEKPNNLTKFVGISSEERESTGQSRADQIEALRAELYDIDPETFVRRAYFEVIIGSTQRTRRLIAVVFGEESREFQLLFSRAGGPSLADLRSRLAHGLASELTQSEARTIRDRLGDVRRICRSLLLRLLLRTPPGGVLPPSKRIASFSLQDPRATVIATGLPEQDWTIQPEWVAWN